MSRAGTDIDRHVGAVISRRRAILGMTQSALAERLGITFQQVQKYEKGQNRVSASRLHDMSGVLRLAVGDFFPPVAEPTGSVPAPDVWVLDETPEGRRLLAALPRIADPEVRGALSTVCCALAGMT